MQWFNKIADDLIAQRPEGEIVVSSGVSPSGTYHLGTLREVLTAEVIAYSVRRRGKTARHLHIVDDLDVFRKVPANVPAEFEKYLGKPLCDVPAPDGSSKSYADYYLADLLEAGKKLHLDIEIIRSHQKYREGFFAEAIEKAIEQRETIYSILEKVSGHKVDETWSPIQIIEDGYLKNRRFLKIDTAAKTITFEDKDGRERTTSYQDGSVKLNWRVDWPARWWLLGVNAEPFGRDHATKGGSYDTGVEIVRQVFNTEPPLPIPYNFINRTGETKKMSKSAGNVITAADLLKMLPAEVVWFFILRYPPEKQLFFDEAETLMRLVDEFSEILAKSDKSDDERELVDVCLHGVAQPTVSNVPFSHLVASYQAALKDTDKTLEIIRRTEHASTVDAQEKIIRAELQFIDEWLNKRAPEDIRFTLRAGVNPDDFSDTERKFLTALGDKIATAPPDAGGEWFHEAIYSFKDLAGLAPQALFAVVYRALIGKNSGPRAGWFLSILPRDWLLKRLRLEA